MLTAMKLFAYHWKLNIIMKLSHDRYYLGLELLSGSGGLWPREFCPRGFCPALSEKGVMSGGGVMSAIHF